MKPPPRPTPPANFLGAPTSPHAPPSHPARVVSVGPPAPRKGTHLDEALLTVRLPNRILLSNHLCRQLGAMMCRDGLHDLGHGSPIELEPPRLGKTSGARRWRWHLDVRSTAPARLTHTGNSRPQFDTLRVLPSRLLLPGVFGTHPAAYPLRLRLLPGVPDVPGYYPLELVRG